MQPFQALKHVRVSHHLAECVASDGSDAHAVLLHFDEDFIEDGILGRA